MFRADTDEMGHSMPTRSTVTAALSSSVGQPGPSASRNVGGAVVGSRRGTPLASLHLCLLCDCPVAAATDHHTLGA